MFMMHSDAPNEAVKYTSIILVCYVIGMILLLLHFVKQKYGQVRSANINLWSIIAIMKIPNLGFLAIDSLHKNYKEPASMTDTAILVFLKFYAMRGVVTIRARVSQSYVVMCQKLESACF